MLMPELRAVAPPDTTGDLGPNHYVQWVNLRYAVYNVTRGASNEITGFTLAAPSEWKTIKAIEESPYSMAKAGLFQQTKVLARDWAQHGIRVNVIAPGHIHPSPRAACTLCPSATWTRCHSALCRK
mgnify:CR=1 FL=1